MISCTVQTLSVPFPGWSIQCAPDGSTRMAPPRTYARPLTGVLRLFTDETDPTQKWIGADFLLEGAGLRRTAAMAVCPVRVPDPTRGGKPVACMPLDQFARLALIGVCPSAGDYEDEAVWFYALDALLRAGCKVLPKQDAEVDLAEWTPTPVARLSTNDEVVLNLLGDTLLGATIRRDLEREDIIDPVLNRQVRLYAAWSVEVVALTTVTAHLPELRSRLLGIGDRVRQGAGLPRLVHEPSKEVGHIARSTATSP